MSKFVEREKMSKKARRELDRSRRAVWVISPVTRRTDDKRKYSRKRKPQVHDDLQLPFYRIYKTAAPCAGAAETCPKTRGTSWSS